MPGPVFDPLPSGPEAMPLGPVSGFVEPAHAIRLIVWLFLGFVAATAATFFLPDNRYIRHQQAQGTLMFHAQWIYERIVFDRAPIDVAVVGASRFEAAISPPILSRELSEAGRPVRVVNLSLVRPGRDFTYETIRSLLRFHPETKLVVLSADGDSGYSQPMFKATADADEVVAAPLLINIKYFQNVLYLPYRNISYFFQSLLPNLAGVSPNFDRRKYAGSYLDRTLGYVTADGERVNGNKSMPINELVAESQKVVETTSQGAIRYLGVLPHRFAEPGERYYVQKIAELCARHDVQIVFVQTPIFGPQQVPIDRSFYHQFGPLLSLLPIARYGRLYANPAHLNRSGAIVASTLLGRDLKRLETERAAPTK